jgi:hypothetical protein
MEDGKMTQVKMTAYSDDLGAKLWIVTATGKLLTETRRRGANALKSIRKTWANLQANLIRKGFVEVETYVVDTELPF